MRQIVCYLPLKGHRFIDLNVNCMFVIALIASALAQCSEASFFVYADGRYELTIEVPGEWDAARLRTSLHGVMDIPDWPEHGVSLEGHLDHVPDELWVSLQLEHDQSGNEISLVAPTILIPRAMPNLGGANKSPLPPISFSWRVNRLLHKLFFTQQDRLSQSDI